MENKKLFMISFLVNFIFSMITVLLSLIVFKINKSSTDISLVMIAFIGSLLITRGVLLKNFLSSRSEIVIGSGIFSIGCLLMFLGSTKLLFMFFGAVAFGLAIGMIPPAILSLLSSDDEVNKDMNLGIYNAIVALAAVFSPKIGEEMYDLNPQLLFEIWLILAIGIFLLALLIKEQQNNSSEDTLVNLKKVVTNSKFQIYFLTLLFSSISYGAYRFILQKSSCRFAYIISFFGQAISWCSFSKK
ncbi:MFS transporter [Ligilactobacillus apodemi]|nr:MFS transporter [Ligilactobacillus apodemi]